MGVYCSDIDYPCTLNKDKIDFDWIHCWSSWNSILRSVFRSQYDLICSMSDISSMIHEVQSRGSSICPFNIRLRIGMESIMYIIIPSCLASVRMYFFAWIRCDCISDSI